MSFILLSTLCLGIFSFCLGIFTLVKNSKSIVNRLWFLLSLAVTVWSIGYVLTMFADNEAEAGIPLVVVYCGAIFIPALFFHFITSFLHLDRKYRLFILLSYLGIPVFLYLLFFSTLLISGATFTPVFGYHEKIGSLFYIFLLYFFMFPIFGFILLLNAYSKSDGIRHSQLFYIMLASIIGFIGGGTNFITDIYHIYPYGQLVIFLYPLLITYGIFLPNLRIRF